MIKIEPAPAVNVDERQQIKTEEILQLSDESSNEENKNDFPILRKNDKNRNMSKKRAADLVQRIMDNPQKLKLKSRSDDKKNFSSGRSKRSPGFVNYVKAVLAGYEEDCEEVARGHYVKAVLAGYEEDCEEVAR